MERGGTKAQAETVDMCHFSLHNPDSNSSVKGAMFAKIDDSDRYVIISGFVDIKPGYTNAVGFYISDGWEVVERTSSYPNGNMSVNPERYIVTWKHSGGTFEKVEVGFIVPHLPYKGNDGVVIIRLEPEDRRTPPDVCNISVWVGSDGGYIPDSSFGDFSLAFPETEK